MSEQTADLILEQSHKSMLESYWVDYRAVFKVDPPHHRNPDSCIGLLSKEMLHEMLTTVDHSKLLITSGLSLTSNDEVAFFSDDPGLGLGVIPPTLRTFTFQGIQWQYGPGQRFPNVDAIIAQFFKGKRVLNSVEELAAYTDPRMATDGSH